MGAGSVGWILAHRSRLRLVRELLRKHGCSFTLDDDGSGWCLIRIKKAARRFFVELDGHIYDDIIWGTS